MRPRPPRFSPLIPFLNASALTLVIQIAPGCGPSITPRMPPSVPPKSLPAAQAPKARPQSTDSRGLTPIPTLVPSVPLNRVPSGTDLEQVNQTLLALQNEQRKLNGKPPLELNPKLTAAAKLQATYCANHHELTHTGDNNSSVGDRVSAQGYKWAAVAENAAMQSPAPQGWPGPDPRTPQRAVQDWMKSRGHRANLLGTYSQCGACYADAQDGTRYWIVTFATPQKAR